jgi:hypothetical protein
MVVIEDRIWIVFNYFGIIPIENGLDWTIVRLPVLIDKPASGKINAGYTVDRKVNLFSLSRADIADFLRNQMDYNK